MFTDEAVITVRSGSGGAGAVSFHREKYVPKGGPDGGDGGRGGDVVFLVRANVKTLSHLHGKRHHFAQNGRPGAGRQRSGQDGRDAEIVVPPGTIVYDAETGERLADLVTEGERHVLLSGGRGGKGNTHFKSSRIQTPRFAQPGEEGEERRLRVELHIIADVGFVGFPNAGKSTLLKALTAAKPKVGAYPFTTLIPHLGVLRRGDTDVVLADIPGIIEGASEGAGLGLRFLKHISRTKGLAFVIDVSAAEPVAQYNTLVDELRRYASELALKERLVVCTKFDLVQSKEVDAAVVGAIRAAVAPVPCVVVSAAASYALDELEQALFALAQRKADREDEYTD